MELLPIEYNKKTGIYRIRNIIDGKIYIGSSCKLRIRQKIHLRSLNKGTHHSIHLQRSWNKYGKESFVFEILECGLDEHQLIAIEQKYIDNYRPEYNTSPTAGSSLGQIRSPESREKMRLAQLGMKHTPERCKIKSISQGGENHWTKKKKISTEIRTKLSQIHKKKYDEGYIHPMKGIPLSQERIEKMKNLNCKAVDQLTIDGIYIKTWKSAAHVRDILGISQVCAVCKGRHKSAGGFKWRYSLPIP